MRADLDGQRAERQNPRIYGLAGFATGAVRLLPGWATAGKDIAFMDLGVGLHLPHNVGIVSDGRTIMHHDVAGAWVSCAWPFQARQAWRTAHIIAAAPRPALAKHRRHAVLHPPRR